MDPFCNSGPTAKPPWGKEPSWHRKLRLRRQVARLRLLAARKPHLLEGDYDLTKEKDRLEAHHSAPAYSMWRCSCGTQNRQQVSWCYHCFSHYSYSWGGKAPRDNSSWRGRSKSVKKPSHGKGKQKGKNQAVSDVLRPFSTSRREPVRDLSPPWKATTPATRSRRATSLEEKDEKEENADGTAGSTDLQEQIRTLASHAEVPKELKAALVRYAIQEGPSVTHTDLNKIKRYKSSILKNHQSLVTLHGKWQRYQKNIKENYQQQRKYYLEQRTEIVKNLREAKASLEQLQREVSEKAKEEPIDLEIPENGEEEIEMESPPWDQEDSELEEPPELNEEKSKAMFPFGRPPKVPRTNP